MTTSQISNQQPATGGTTTPRKGNAGQKTIFGRALRSIKWTLALLVTLLAIAWLAGMPDGVLRLAMVEAVKNDPEKAKQAEAIFERVDAAIEDAVKYHQQLSFIEDDGSYQLEIPGPPPHTETGLTRYLRSASVEAALKEEPTSIQLAFDIVAMIEKSYEWLGLVDYYLVVRDLRVIPCGAGPRSTCWKVIAQFKPSNMHSDEFVGTEESLARDLAVFVVRGAARNKGDDLRTSEASESPTFLTESAVPVTMAALEQTAQGLEILKLGLTHHRCYGRTRIDCINIANQALTFGGVQTKTVNPVAAYGRSLIELDAALTSADELGPALAVEQLLSNAGTLASQALANDFLRPMISNGRLESSFTLVQLGGVPVGEPLISIARRFSCSLARHRRAQWNGCVEMVGDIGDFPPPLRPYVESALIDATLSVLHSS